MGTQKGQMETIPDGSWMVEGAGLVDGDGQEVAAPPLLPRYQKWCFASSNVDDDCALSDFSEISALLPDEDKSFELLDTISRLHAENARLRNRVEVEAALNGRA